MRSGSRQRPRSLLRRLSRRRRRLRSRSKTGSNTAVSSKLVALQWDGAALLALDQTALPDEERWLALESADEVAGAIIRLSIRGAPLIGVAAAYGVAMEVVRDPSSLERACSLLAGARPTAFNLARAVERMRAAGGALAEAQAIEREEEAASDAIAAHGAGFLAAAGTLLTHCNTGALAAPGRGTALAVIAELAARGSLKRVIATESRPLLQGARLTTYELFRLGIPFELIVDSAAAGLIARDVIDGVIVGCDRVAANGDVANKVGTYGLALAAREAGIPFVVAGPTSTIDLATASGAEIEIEQRDPNEVRAGTPCLNPAFDVTPARLLTAVVTERGVLSPVSADSLAAVCA